MSGVRLALCLLMVGWTHPASPGVGRETHKQVGRGALAVPHFVGLVHKQRQPQTLNPMRFEGCT